MVWLLCLSGFQDEPQYLSVGFYYSRYKWHHIHSQEHRLIHACLILCSFSSFLESMKPCLGNTVICTELVFPCRLTISTVSCRHPYRLTGTNLIFKRDCLLSWFQVMTICHLILAITVPLLEYLVSIPHHHIQPSRLFSYKGEFCIPALLFIIISSQANCFLIKTNSAFLPCCSSWLPMSQAFVQRWKTNPWSLCPFLFISLQVRLPVHCGLAPDSVRWGTDACLACGFLICLLWKAERYQVIDLLIC